MPDASQNYQALRRALIASGYTVRSWASAFGFAPSSVYAALRGSRHGVKAVAIRNKIMQHLYAPKSP